MKVIEHNLSLSIEFCLGLIGTTHEKMKISYQKYKERYKRTENNRRARDILQKLEEKNDIIPDGAYWPRWGNNFPDEDPIKRRNIYALETIFNPKNFHLSLVQVTVLREEAIVQIARRRSSAGSSSTFENSALRDGVMEAGCEAGYEATDSDDYNLELSKMLRRHKLTENEFESIKSFLEKEDLNSTFGSNSSNSTKGNDSDYSIASPVKKKVKTKENKNKSKEISLLLTSEIGLSASSVESILGILSDNFPEQIQKISDRSIRRTWLILESALNTQRSHFIQTSENIVIGSDGSSANGYTIFTFMISNEKNEEICFFFSNLANEKVETVMSAFKSSFNKLTESDQKQLAEKTQAFTSDAANAAKATSKAIWAFLDSIAPRSRTILGCSLHQIKHGEDALKFCHTPVAQAILKMLHDLLSHHRLHNLKKSRGKDFKKYMEQIKKRDPRIEASSLKLARNTRFHADSCNAEYITANFDWILQFVRLYCKEETKIIKLMEKSKDEILPSYIAHCLIYQKLLMPYWNQVSKPLSPQEYRAAFTKTVSNLETISESDEPFNLIDSLQKHGNDDWVFGFEDMLEKTRGDKEAEKKLTSKVKEMAETLGKRLENFSFIENALNIHGNLTFTNVGSERAISVSKHQLDSRSSLPIEKYMLFTMAKLNKPISFIKNLTNGDSLLSDLFDKIPALEKEAAEKKMEKKAQQDAFEAQRLQNLESNYQQNLDLCECLLSNKYNFTGKETEIDQLMAAFTPDYEKITGSTPFRRDFFRVVIDHSFAEAFKLDKMVEHKKLRERMNKAKTQKAKYLIASKFLCSLKK